MAGQSSAMIGWSWTEVSVLGSQVFGQAFIKSCGREHASNFRIFFLILDNIMLSQIVTIEKSVPRLK